MFKSKHSPISPPSGPQCTISQLVSFDPILDEYFRNNAILQRYWNLAHDLMLDGIRYRTEQTIDINQHAKLNQTQFDYHRQISRESAIENKVQLQQNSPQRDFVRENSSPDIKHVNSSDHSNHQSPIDDHDNFEFVKHKRFLSPKQRRQALTPKVTQTIPVSSPQIIYGKPRVRVDDDYGCPYHENAEECLRSIPYGGPCEPVTPNELKNTQYQIHVKQNPAFETIKKPNFNWNLQENILTRDNSTPNINSNPQAQVQFQRQTPMYSNERVQSDEQQKQIHSAHLKTINSPPKPPSQNQKIHKLNKKRKENSETEQTVYVERILQVESRFPGKIKIVQSPKSKSYQNQQESDSYLISRYESNNHKGHGKQAESKIKFLVERDKKSKALEKNMKKQQQRIQQLQEMIKNPTKSQQKGIKEVVSNDILSLSESSKSSEMSMMDSQQMKNYKKTISKKQPKMQKRDSAAYFGTAEVHHFHNQLNAQILDCSCSKTFSEDDDFSERDQTNSEFSHFA